MEYKKGQVNIRKVLCQSIFIIAITILLMVLSVFKILELKYSLNILFIICLVSVFSCLISLGFIVFFLTCLESILIICIDNKFSMRNLFLFNYELMSKTALITSISIFSLYILRYNISEVMLKFISLISNIYFLFRYYNKIHNFAYIHKSAAKLAVAIIMIINFLFIIFI